MSAVVRTLHALLTPGRTNVTRPPMTLSGEGPACSIGVSGVSMSRSLVSRYGSLFFLHQDLCFVIVLVFVAPHCSLPSSIRTLMSCSETSSVYGSCVVQRRWSRTAGLRATATTALFLACLPPREPGEGPTVEVPSLVRAVEGCGWHT